MAHQFSTTKYHLPLHRTVTVILLLFCSFPATGQVTGLAGWDIFIDPGHSKKENLGIYGYSEAEKNVRVALHLQDLLQSKTDIDTVYLSRDNDFFCVSLSQRTDQANSLAASWFHSIHSDAGSPDLNSTLMLWGQYNNGLEKNPPGGQAMSAYMIDILTEVMRTDSRGSFGDCSFYGCSAGFFGPYLHVNRESNMPSELSEAGFHTNPVQNTLNMNEEWKRLEAYAFFWSILAFHELERPPIGIAAGIIRDGELDRPLNGATVSIAGQSYTTDTYDSLFYQYTNDPELLQNGFYFLEDIPIDSVEMITSADGYYSDTLQLAVLADFITFADVELISSLPPAIVQAEPEDSSSNISIFSDISLWFSRRMDVASVEANLSINPPLPSALFSWGDDDRFLKILIDTLDFNTTYTLTISPEATDLFGHALDGNADGVAGDTFALVFTSEEEDLLPPAVTLTDPPAGENFAETWPLVSFVFDEALDAASVTAKSVSLEKTSDAEPMPGTVEYYQVGQQGIITFFPQQRLSSNTDWTATLAPGISDIWGNTTDAAETFSFTTATYVNDVTLIDDFEKDVLDNWWEPQQSGTTTGIIEELTGRGRNDDIVNLLSGSEQSLALQYQWDPDATNWLLRMFLGEGAPRDVWFDAQDILQVYVFGDGSGNRFRFAVDDRVPEIGSANHEVSTWITIDWVGWRLVSWDLATDPVGDWLGDGNLDGILRFDSIQLSHVQGAVEGGFLYFDDLRLVNRRTVSLEDPPATPIPRSYNLAPNFPNPFNPSTVIRYDVPSYPHPVRLAVYDILGREVIRLVDKVQSAGSYEIAWDATNSHGSTVASGTYMYRISIGDYIATRKMTLLR